LFGHNSTADIARELFELCKEAESCSFDFKKLLSFGFEFLWVMSHMGQM